MSCPAVSYPFIATAAPALHRRGQLENHLGRIRKD
uniref:Uncharacterized protein n=1 Tax=Arundo donax TaxID=35708 RepID=A0A0A9A7K0_ARUDO